MAARVQPPAPIPDVVPDIEDIAIAAEGLQAVLVVLEQVALNEACVEWCEDKLKADDLKYALLNELLPHATAMARQIGTDLTAITDATQAARQLAAPTSVPA